MIIFREKVVLSTKALPVEATAIQVHKRKKRLSQELELERDTEIR